MVARFSDFKETDFIYPHAVLKARADGKGADWEVIV